MILARRHFMRLAAGAALLPTLPRTASAQAFSSRPVRMVVGLQLAAPADVLARLMAQWLSDRLKQPFIIENKVGAGGNIATDTVLRSLPDGHTLLMNTMPTIVSCPRARATAHRSAGTYRRIW